MLTRLTLYSDIQEPYARYGLMHFAKKYGLTLAASKQNTDIFISYSANEIDNSKVQILLRSERENKICYLTINGETFPIFQKPKEVESGQQLAKVLDGNREYSCLSLLNNRIIAGFDVFGEIGRILAGDYDNSFLRKDELGVRLKMTPVVDILEEGLFSGICQILKEQYIPQHFVWPGGHKFAIMLTHDVDRAYKTFQYLPSLVNSIKKAKLSEFFYHLNNLFFNHGKKNPYWTFSTICDLENSLGVRSTYYFLNESGKLNPFSLKSWILFRGVYNIQSLPIKGAIRELDANGFEIGVHGSYLSYNDLGLLQSEKSVLESITGSKVKGVRQHYLNYDKKLTPGIHIRSGFAYDTSIGFKPDDGAIGFRRGTSFPFWVMTSELNVSNLLEIPLIIMDGDSNADQRLEKYFTLMDQVEKHHGVLTILWHTNNFNYRESPRMINTYKDIVNEAKRRGAWMATADEICDWVKR